MTTSDIMHLIAMAMVLFLVLPGFLYYTRIGGKQAALRNIALWVIIGLVAAIAYSQFGQYFENF